MARAPLTPAEIERIVELREQLTPIRQIARIVGCSQGPVERVLLAEGVDVCLGHALPDVPDQPIVQARGGHLIRRFCKAEDERLLALEAQGLKPNQIARALGRRWASTVGRLRTLARREARAEGMGG